MAADYEITNLTGLAAPATDDVVYIIDISDTTDSTDGTGKKATLASLFSTITFTSPTISSPTLTGGATMTIADTENASITINQNDVTNDPVGLDINNTGSGVALEVDNDGTNHGVWIHQDGVQAASDYALHVESNAVQVNAPLAFFDQDSATSDQSVLRLRNDGTGSALYVDQNGNGTALRIDNDGTSHGIHVTQDAVSAASSYGLYVYSNAAQVNSPLAYMKQDNASSDQNVLALVNDGTGKVLAIQQSGTGTALDIDNDSTGTALNIDQSSSGASYAATITNSCTNGALYILQEGIQASSQYALYVLGKSTAAQVNAPLVRFVQNSTTSDQAVLTLDNDGTGICLRVNNDDNSTAEALRVDNDGSSHGINIVHEASGDHPIFITNASANNSIEDDSGALLSAAGTWTDAPSYRRYKDKVETIKVLDRVRELDIDVWKYKDEEIDGKNRYKSDQNKHCSPYLDDWYDMFGLGADDNVTPMDYVGVLLLAVKELTAEVEKLKNG